METLIYQITFSGEGGYLKDSRGNSLGYFATFEAAQAWCKENNYRVRKQ